MNRKRITWTSVLAAAAVAGAIAAFAIAQAQGDGNDDFAKVKAATARFHRTETAQAEQWDLRPGLDNCFDKPGTGGMGFHYINLTELHDLSENPLRPEALVYIPGPNGQRQLGAVEYIVPTAEWDAAGHTSPPELFGQTFAQDMTLGVYELHVWLFKDNPSGLFEDFNPKAPLCPAN